MRSVLLNTLLVVFIQGISLEINACTCIRPKLNEAVRAADDILEGEVLTINSTLINEHRLKTEYPAEYEVLSIELVVSTVYKGQPSRDTVVVLSRIELDCQYPFEIGQTYIVFGNVWEVELRKSVPSKAIDTDFCSATSLSTKQLDRRIRRILWWQEIRRR